MNIFYNILCAIIVCSGSVALHLILLLLFFKQYDNGDECTFLMHFKKMYNVCTMFFFY